MRCNQSTKYLGVRINPKNQYNEEFDQRVSQVKDMDNIFKKAPLNPRQAWLAYNFIWLPKLKYIAP